MASMWMPVLVTWIAASYLCLALHGHRVFPTGTRLNREVRPDSDDQPSTPSRDAEQVIRDARRRIADQADVRRRDAQRFARILPPPLSHVIVRLSSIATVVSFLLGVAAVVLTTYALITAHVADHYYYYASAAFDSRALTIQLSGDSSVRPVILLGLSISVVLAALLGARAALRLLSALLGWLGRDPKSTRRRTYLAFVGAWWLRFAADWSIRHLSAFFWGALATTYFALNTIELSSLDKADFGHLADAQRLSILFLLAALVMIGVVGQKDSSVAGGLDDRDARVDKCTARSAAVVVVLCYIGYGVLVFAFSPFPEILLSESPPVSVPVASMVVVSVMVFALPLVAWPLVFVARSASRGGALGEWTQRWQEERVGK